jgi:hypothetical protein
MKSISKIHLCALIAPLLWTACSQQKFVHDSDEIANAAGDVTASLDEMLGVAGGALLQAQPLST